MVAGSTVFATIVNPCSTSAFSPLIQSGGIVFKGIKNMEHQNQVQAPNSDLLSSYLSMEMISPYEFNSPVLKYVRNLLR